MVSSSSLYSPERAAAIAVFNTPERLVRVENVTVRIKLTQIDGHLRPVLEFSEDLVTTPRVLAETCARMEIILEEFSSGRMKRKLPSIKVLEDMLTLHIRKMLVFCYYHLKGELPTEDVEDVGSFSLSGHDDDETFEVRFE